MSMEINERYHQSKINYAERIREEQASKRAEKAKETNEKTNAKISEPQDEYISSEKSGTKPTGLYRVGQDEKGNRKIDYDDPKKSGNANEKEQPKVDENGSDNRQPKVSGNNGGKPVEKCTTDTDKVDREIKKLKEKKQNLEQQIRAASGDQKKVRELEKKLVLIENELSQKDNDTYRRQNASVSE